MPRAALTDLFLRSVKSEVQIDYWDTKTPAFAVRVGKHAKTFVAKVNNRRVTIGAYPQLSLQAARKKALALKIEEPAEKAKVISFKEARDKFLEIHGARLKPRSLREITRLLHRYFHWNKSLDKITHDDVATAVEAIAAKSEATHALKDIRTFFNWCVPRYITHSPCQGIKSATRYVPRQRALTDIELKSVWSAAERVGYPFGTILKLLIITGQRWGEIVSLRWPYVDAKAKTITLPDTKNGRPHTFPYNGMVSKILKTIPRRNATNLLFPGRDNETPWNGAGKAKYLLEWRPAIKPWTIHDLRRTFAFNWQRMGVRIELTERALNHVSGIMAGIVGVYQTYDYLPELRECYEKWDVRLTEILAREQRAFSSAGATHHIL